jgi:penicillin-binding protein 2
MTDSSRVRVSIVGVVVVALFSTLLVRLWFLQSGAEGNLKVQADIASTRVIQTESPRGEILDRNGVVLVRDRSSWAVTVDRNLSDHTVKRVLGQLAEQLGIPAGTLESQYVSERQSPLKPAVVALDVSQENRLAILQDPQDYPGVRVTRLTVRSYPAGNLAAQLLGYVGEVPEEDMASLERRGYQPGDSIGQAGVEAVYESALRGRPRRETVLVNPQGRQVGSPVDVEPGTVGDNVYLTIDSKVQKVAESSLEQGILAVRQIQDRSPEVTAHGFQTFKAPAGAAVVLDASDGSVVADASFPTYPLSYWVGGISQDHYTAITNPYSGYPMLNRATQGQYAPGSTFKLVTSLAMTQYGIRGIGDYWDDEGHVSLDGTDFKNAGSEVFGPVNLEQALTVSSDTYFYKVGDDFWHIWKAGDEQRGMGIQTKARELGFGSPTGVAVDESTGRVPDPKWKADFAHKYYTDQKDQEANSIWYPFDDIFPAVGQGDLTVTPLQLANAYAAFANGGTLWRPRIAEKVTDSSRDVVDPVGSKAIRHISFDPATRAAMMAGFTGAVSNSQGTAAAAFQGFPFDQVPLAGKTGTAQVAGKDDTSLFVGMFGGTPENPKYVVAVVVEQAGFGAQTAAPVARRIIEKMSHLPAPPVVVTEQGHD